ncbi:MAG: ABC transporter permease, partial [Proteobacteria bacterium]|nr:ABC transporter permease [Pseudomonadota bacterium]
MDGWSALSLVVGLDPALMAIVRLSLFVSAAATALAATVALPLGAALALLRFPA